jgi:hypothetical protein
MNNSRKNSVNDCTESEKFSLILQDAEQNGRSNMRINYELKITNYCLPVKITNYCFPVIFNS